MNAAMRSSEERCWWRKRRSQSQIAYPNTPIAASVSSQIMNFTGKV